MSDVIIGNFMQLLSTTYIDFTENVADTKIKTIGDTEANVFQNASIAPIRAKAFEYEITHPLYRRQSVVSHRDFQFLSFIYQGATRSKDGDNLQASIVMSFNALTISSVEQIVREKAFIRVTTLLLQRAPDEIHDPNSGEHIPNPDAGKLTVSTAQNADGIEYEKTISEEVWVATSFNYDDTSIEIQLTSPMDAVQAFAPHRILTSEEVGVLPLTGTLQNL